MGAVPKEKAGVASAVNGSTRLFGGTLGVAVIGSVAASLYTSQIHKPARRGVLHADLSARALSAAQGSVGGAAAAAQQRSRAGLARLAHAVDNAAVPAFLHSFTGGCLAATGAAAAGALLVAIFLPARPRAEHAHAQPAAARPQPRAPTSGRCPQSCGQESPARRRKTTRSSQNGPRHDGRPSTRHNRNGAGRMPPSGPGAGAGSAGCGPCRAVL